ncbi:MAG: type II toxin-antitoxin system RelE/ParE family toxin [Gammaproteobacteria bacterium]|nr:type II toxin-antitoxin system RelE/ParE family toxin [Gammaproteobacteria bacterium]
MRQSGYVRALQNILRYIALDNPLAAMQLERELNARLELVRTHPEMCRPSSYMGDPRYRDMIYQGYTLTYKIEASQILLLDMFKWQLRSKKAP